MEMRTMQIFRNPTRYLKSEIKRRKRLTISALRNMNNIFNSNKLSIKMKSRFFFFFNAYASSIFQSNSEIWTVTKNDENTIDAFQRRLLINYVLSIRWLKKISTENLYDMTRQSKWSKIIARRLIWLGDLARLSNETPANRL